MECHRCVLVVYSLCYLTFAIEFVRRDIIMCFYLLTLSIKLALYYEPQS
jgi:hypothetical protein